MLHGSLSDLPRLRAPGSCDVDGGVGLQVGRHILGELELLHGRRQDQNTGRVKPEGEASHPLAEEGAVGTSVGGLTLVVELAIGSASHDDVTRGRGVTRSHPQFCDLRAQFDRVQAVVDEAAGHLHGVGNDDVGQVVAAIEGTEANGGQALGKDNATQGRVVRERGVSDLDGAFGHRELGSRVRGQRQDENLARVGALVEDATIDGKHGVGRRHSQRRQRRCPEERRFSDRGQPRTQVQAGQGTVAKERALSDARHRVGQRDRCKRRVLEGVVGYRGEAFQVGAEVHLGQRPIVTESTVRDLRRSTQVDALELGHVPERHVIHGFEAVGKCQGGDLRARERGLFHVAQGRGQGDGGYLSVGECIHADRLGPFGERIVTAGVLRWRVGRQLSQALCVQDAVEALVALVGRVDVNALQARRAREGVQ